MVGGKNMYCQNCGAKIEQGAEYCSSCGNSIKNNSNGNVEVSNSTSSSIGWGILGFFIPIVGLVLFLVWKQERPKDSKAAGIGALISIIAYIVLIIIFMLISAMIISASSSYY